MSILTPERRAELRFLAERTPLFWGDEELVAVAEDLPALLDALDAAETALRTLADAALHPGDPPFCRFCETTEHAPDCPVRRALEVVDG